MITSGEAGLLGALDPAVLDAAAALDRVLWTHDIRTMPAYVRDRVAAGRSTPGVIVVRTGTPFRRVIDDLLLVADCGIPSDLRDRVAYIPL